MDFEPTDTQRELGGMVTRLMRDRYDFAARQKLFETGAGFSQGMWARYAELGLLGVAFGEEHGGIGGGFADVAIIMEALGAALALEPVIPALILGGGLIAAAGSGRQADELLPRIASGDLLPALAHAESDPRQELSHVETRAVREGDAWRLDGAKRIVLGGHVADRLIVSARTAGRAGDAAGISLFLVNPGAAGVAIDRYRTFDGMGAADVDLAAVAVPAEGLLGMEGAAYHFIEHAFDRAIAAQCAEAVGAMGAANAITLDYLKTRKQFGATIGSFQALQHKMVDMVAAHDHARSLAIVAARYADLDDVAERGRMISAAKLGVDRAATLVGQQAIQLHGGIGMTEEYPVGHYLRRLTAIGLTFGDAGLHVDRIMAASAADGTDIVRPKKFKPSH